MILLTPEEKLVILKRCRHKGETLIPKLLDETTKAQLKKDLDILEQFRQGDFIIMDSWSLELMKQALEEVK